MFDHKWKCLIVKGDAALRQHSINKAEGLYCQSILESDRLLKSFRSPSCKNQWTLENCLKMISMMIFSHHNMADLWVRYGVRMSQTYYLEMAHQKLIDTVRDTRFSEELRMTSLSELNKTYIPLLSHYKTNQLANDVQLLVEQYSRVRETFDTELGVNYQRTELLH